MGAEGRPPNGHPLPGVGQDSARRRASRIPAAGPCDVPALYDGMVRYRSCFTRAKRFALRGAACLGLLFAWPAQADPGAVALVVGGTSYTGLPSLPACARSATDIAGALTALGFETNLLIDAPNQNLAVAAAAMSRRLAANPGPSIVYVCGYAAGVEARAYLLPVNANPFKPADVAEQAFPVTTFLDANAQGGKMPAVLALDLIARPGDQAPFAVDALTPAKVSPGLGIIAARSPIAPGNAPTVFGQKLLDAVAVRVVRSDGLVSNMDEGLWGTDATVELQRQPSLPGYLAGAPKIPGAMTAPSAPARVVLPDETRMTEQDRREVQNALSRIGLYKGPVTGRFDEATRSAINVFQIKLGAPMTGRLTGAQATELVAADR